MQQETERPSTSAPHPRLSRDERVRRYSKRCLVSVARDGRRYPKDARPSIAWLHEEGQDEDSAMWLTDDVSLLQAYQHWWSPRTRPAPYVPPPPREVTPHCNTWYPRSAPRPPTARWALVQGQWPPGLVIYYKSREAAVWRFEELPYADHPHVRLVPVERL